MPSLHFGGSPYGHVKPPLLQALSLKRKKSRVAVTAAAAVFKVFTNSRGRDAILRQGVKYRNMFHAGSGLVRERQPGEEVTQEKGWVTDEESEHSETEESEEEVVPVVVKAEDEVERLEAEQETIEEAEVSVVAAEEESTMNLIHEAEEVANTDLLKLEISLAEKEIPQAPVPHALAVHVKEEIGEAEVLSAQESTSERPIGELVEQDTPEVALPKEAGQQVPDELLVAVVEQVEEQEPVTEDKFADAVLVPEPQLELVLEPTQPEPLSLASVMNLLEPAEREPLTFSTVINTLQQSKLMPAPSMVAMEVVETSMPEPFNPMAVMEIADAQQPKTILEVNEAEVSPLDDIPGEIQVQQEDIKADNIDILGEIQVAQEDIKTVDIEQQTEAEIQEALVELEETKDLSEESTLEVEMADISPNSTIGREPEVQETAPMIQPPFLPSIDPTLEVQVEELTEEIVEKSLPIHVQVISPQPPQDTPVSAISEKHSEQLFDEYDETELNEDEEPEVEVELENLELKGSLEFTPSHMFKLTLPIPSSVNSPSPSTVVLCVKPEQTLLDLQKLIQVELYTTTGSRHISFTTPSIEPPDHTTEIVFKPDSTGFATNDRENSILRRPSCSDPSKFSSKPTCLSTRWSLSTEIGAFIGDISRRQCFDIGISHTSDKPPSTTIRISLPSFNDRTLHQRAQLRNLAPNLSSLSALKLECDAAVQRTAQKRSILTLAMSGFACLLLPLIFITFAYLSQSGLLSSFHNSQPGELRLSYPVTTYIVAGLGDILLLAGFAYLWSVYRTTGRAPDLATVHKVYSERGFDVAKWEELQTENMKLCSEIRRVAAEYGVTWGDEVGQTKETGTAATAA
ncbi:hypothetical protein L211DRAFT_849932 [Terfezia boudieri ATCC MYA-4762]|uniref:Uncharacterized protein n=1 Tax=Terfezia boudieri ATCC MYA-4762 TaxID=1051890 RepID=A0A3N4LKG8_9PEZI|nr:hypothetical protein L211DRAFT_849932 [Terfezia boudieri ATCC MYA-4762]